MSAKRRVLVIGYGNPWRGDDGAGWAAAERLGSLLPPGVELKQMVSDGAALMEAWDGWDVVIVVDASAPNGKPGAVQRLEGSAVARMHLEAAPSSHALGLAEAVKLAEALDAAPNKLVVFAIEGKQFEPGSSLSKEVRAAVDATATEVLHEIEKAQEA